MPRTQGQLIGRIRTLEILNSLLSKNFNVTAIIGWGGIGKTALAKRWISEVSLRSDNFFERIFEWTFYGQSSLDGVVSTKPFEEALITFFELPNLKGQAFERGHEAASFISVMSSLIVIDGLEVLQIHAGEASGEITDPFLRTFIFRLAQENSGFCLLTSRVSVSELNHLSRNCFRELSLRRMPKKDGALLLRNCGVKGSREMLEQASDHFDGHPLSLLLVGKFLTEFLDANIVRLSDMDLASSDLIKDNHAARVLSSYDDQLSNGEVAVLRLLGLFNRPSSIDEIFVGAQASGAIFRSDNLLKYSQHDLEHALSRLNRLSLINTYRDSGIKVDCHPLVRGYQDHCLRSQS